MQEIFDAIKEVLDYSFDKELNDYRTECFEHERKYHIFNSLVVLRNWLDGTEMKAEDYLEVQ